MEKNKIIFVTAIGLVVLFIIGYAFMLTGDGDGTDTELKQPVVPELKEEQKEYGSKLEAVDDVREKRESNAPSVYDDAYLDSTEIFGSRLDGEEKRRIADSIYRDSRIDYGAGTSRGHGTSGNSATSTKDLAKAHEAFFNVPEMRGTVSESSSIVGTDPFIMVEVNGEQTVRNDERLELRLIVDALINGDTVPRNSLIYGFVGFRANRVSVRIKNIDNSPVELKAFDLMDGNEGIYIRNSLRAEATGEVIDDIVQDISIPGVPQIGGIKQVFRRNNRNVKATIYNQYQLILKPTL